MIKYIKGDATKPIGEGNKIICHICNDIGAWGAGFVLAISNRWPQPERVYRNTPHYVQGDITLVNVEDDIWVANMIAQHDIRMDEQGDPPIRYASVKVALHRVNAKAVEMGATIHMPRIGCGLAGGKWEEIEKIINETLTVDVTIYDF